MPDGEPTLNCGINAEGAERLREKPIGHWTWTLDNVLMQMGLGSSRSLGHQGRTHKRLGV